MPCHACMHSCARPSSPSPSRTHANCCQPLCRTYCPPGASSASIANPRAQQPAASSSCTARTPSPLRPRPLTVRMLKVAQLFICILRKLTPYHSTLLSETRRRRFACGCVQFARLRQPRHSPKAGELAPPALRRIRNNRSSSGLRRAEPRPRIRLRQLPRLQSASCALMHPFRNHRRPPASTARQPPPAPAPTSAHHVQDPKPAANFPSADRLSRPRPAGPPAFAALP
ncbi:hypothetical protein BS50DRAFT_279385 [Corynespora cassiicola Philippines]|uniref:Uncharacterized protein n=1 Tax=Corynespora cassiicola Philippines TaxID=1448308 RepID=A0A2T2P0Q7_CORCC|nr:hypothetical protein BS50DRAFT_279385 [Corynespora cassiicola Philippines]